MTRAHLDTSANWGQSPIYRTGALIRRERLARDWSLKGLAHGICAVSYLSKIERGEADPSPEIIGALLRRLGVDWHDDEAFLARARDLLNRGYDAVLSYDEAAFPALREELAELAKTNEQYQSDIDRLQSREGIEDEARRRGYVAEGESEIVVDGTLPTDADQDGARDEGIPWYLALGDFVFQYR